MFCLKVASDESWAHEAHASLGAVLVDHAHCEMKAAANAMSLAGRPGLEITMARSLIALAREELEHFDRVLGFLEARGLALGAPPVDTYAAELRTALGVMGASPFGANGGVVDRLLVGALIEARSCERFKLLLQRLEREPDRELHAFYEELFAAEARHYRMLVDLAVTAAEGRRDEVMARLDRLAEHEGAIVTRLSRKDERAAIHG